MPRPRRPRPLLGLLVGALAALVLAGCGTVDVDSNSGGSAGAETSATTSATPSPTPTPSPTTTRAARPEPLLYVVGDSYVEGTVQNAGPEFPALTARRLGWRAASDGLGSTGYLARLDGRPKYVDRLDADLAHRTPAVLVVAGGANDRDLPLDDVVDAAQDFFDRAYDLKSWARLVVISPWVPQAETYRPDLDAALRRLTREAGGTWVDTHTWFTDHPELIGSDGDHPTQAGQAYIAAQLAPVVRQVARAEP